VEIKTSNIILYCHKWHDTVAFYRDTLRFPVNFSNEWFVEFQLTENARISVANRSKSSIKSCQGKGITISLEVEDLEALHALMEKVRLKPTMVKEIWESKQFYIYDPEGNRIEFWS
jgi:catechol-2,3-dioxygenase